MLRTLVFTLAIAVPGMAMADPPADQFPHSALHADVLSDNGTIVGRVESVERNAEGEVVAAEISGQEPGSAPFAADDLMAEGEYAERVLVNAREDRDPIGGDVRLR